MVITHAEVLAFRQHCVNVWDDSEVERGLAAARKASASRTFSAENVIAGGYWESIPIEHQEEIKRRLIWECYRELADAGYIPVDFPHVDIIREGSWSLTRIRAEVRARNGQ